MSDPSSWLAVAAGGALGAIFRAAIYRFVDFRFGGGRAGSSGALALPSTVATLSVNVAGSLLLGLVLGKLGESAVASATDTLWSSHVFWATGVCGALTTFSTFCADAVALLDRRERAALALYLIGNALLSIVALLGGLSLFG